MQEVDRRSAGRTRFRENRVNLEMSGSDHGFVSTPSIRTVTGTSNTPKAPPLVYA